MEHGDDDISIFKGHDFVMLGDIHKPQILDAEKRVQYAGSTIQQNFSEDGRKGYRELNVTKLDSADLQEFLDVVLKVENYYFSDQFPDLENQGLHKVIEQPELLKKVAMDISADLLVEIMEASGNLAVLKQGEKKSSNSQPTSASGEVKKEKD